MIYSKEMQLGKRRKPKRKNRTKIKEKDYQQMIDCWGANCIYCGSPHIEAHHVRYRSQGGKGVYRNLLPLCQKHHRDAHTYESIRKSLIYKLEQEFGEDFYKDRWDLYYEGKIEAPTDSEYERYFEGGI